MPVEYRMLAKEREVSINDIRAVYKPALCWQVADVLHFKFASTSSIK